MEQIGGENPKRPEADSSENENPTSRQDKDHVSNEPESGEMITTGEEPDEEDEEADGQKRK